jgi:CTP:molybdopterin cytidylyltransferase MocA
LLSPDLALAYLGELSTDIRAGVVLSAAGERLAGSEALAGSARDLLAASDAPLIEVETARGTVVAARSATHALAVVAGRQALPALVRFDVRRTVADLDGGDPA